MALRQFSKSIKKVPILSYSSGTSDRSSAVIDTMGFDGFFIAIHNAAVNNSAVADYYLQHADAASNSTTLTSGADVSTSSQTIATDSDDKLMWIEVINPTKRYYQLVVNNDATNATAQSAVAYLWRGDELPVTDATGSGTSGGSAAVVTGESMIHPSSGTK